MIHRRDFLRHLGLGLVWLGTGCSPNILSDATSGLYGPYPGIYSLSRNVRTLGDATVLVHPYYVRPTENQQYYACLFDFLSQYDGMVVALVGKESLEDAVAKMNLQRDNDTAFIVTGPYSPDPVEIGWNEVSSFLRSFDEPIKLAGGYYHGQDSGCLGRTEHELAKRGLKTQLLPDMMF